MTNIFECILWHVVAPHTGYQRWWLWDWKAQPEEQALKPGLMIPETLVGALPVEKRESGWSKLRDCQPQMFINGQQWSIQMSPCQDFRTTSFYNLREKKVSIAPSGLALQLYGHRHITGHYSWKSPKSLTNSMAPLQNSWKRRRRGKQAVQRPRASPWPTRLVPLTPKYFSAAKTASLRLPLIHC